MANKVDCLVVPEIFVRIKTELLESGEVALELQLPSTPIIRNGIAETKVVLTKDAVSWLSSVLMKYQVQPLVKALEAGNYDATPSELKQGTRHEDPRAFDAFAKELDESADKLPAAAFAVNPKVNK